MLCVYFYLTSMIDTKKILLRYYIEDTPLFRSLWIHSNCVMQKALRCASLNNIRIDIDFTIEAALLHDIGIFKCYAPDIHCTGTLPYICHGVEGRKILENEGLYRHALVCERHTGSGLSLDNIINQDLPLPHRDMLPQSTEEELICYADKFFSKSGDIDKEKNIDDVVKQMKKLGDDVLSRFEILHKKFAEK